MERPRGAALRVPRKRWQLPRARRRRQRIAEARAQTRRRSEHCRLKVERQLAASRAQLAGQPQCPRHQRRRARVAVGLHTRGTRQRVLAVRASRAQRRQSSPAGAAPSRGHVPATLVYVHVVTRPERSRAAPQAASGEPGLMRGGAAAIALAWPARTSRSPPTTRGLPGTNRPEAAGATRGLQSPGGGQGCRLVRAAHTTQWKARETSLPLSVEDRRSQARELLALHFHRTTCLNLPYRSSDHAYQGRGASAQTTTRTRRSTPDPPGQLHCTPRREGDEAAVGAAPEAPRQHKDPRQLRRTPGVPGRPQRPEEGRGVGSRSQVQAIHRAGAQRGSPAPQPPPNAKRARARDDLRLQRHGCRAAHVRRHRGANP